MCGCKKDKIPDFTRICAMVDLNAIRSNLREMKKRLRADTKITAVIKTDGYGHGACEIAKCLEKEEYLWGFAVATAEEAVALRASGRKKPIIILGYTFAEDYEQLISQEIRFTVISLEMAERISEIAGKSGKTAYIHIKMDTGMHRIGYDGSVHSMEEIEKICHLPHLYAEGIFTHFARSDEADKTIALRQYDRFCDMIEQLEKRGMQFKMKHCSNSAAILELPQVQMDMVRAGITLYGLWPSEEMDHSFPLLPAMSLYSRIVSVKELPAGEPISYGGTYVTSRPTRIATIPAGYGDGYPRSLSNRGYVLIHGKKAAILGRICMDQFMVDISDIPEAQILDTVTLLGENEGTFIGMEELGELSGRFNYEFACDIGKRVPRIYVDKNRENK